MCLIPSRSPPLPWEDERVRETEPLHLTSNPSALSPGLTASSASPINLFLMVNTFETGGSERQFSVLAQNLNPPEYQTHLGCVSRRGPLAHHFPDTAQFPLGGSLFGWRSLRSRLNLRRHLRQHRVQVAHAFDFYANLTLIPAAKLANVPVVIGSGSLRVLVGSFDAGRSTASATSSAFIGCNSCRLSSSNWNESRMRSSATLMLSGESLRIATCTAITPPANGDFFGNFSLYCAACVQGFAEIVTPSCDSSDEVRSVSCY